MFGPKKCDESKLLRACKNIRGRLQAVRDPGWVSNQPDPLAFQNGKILFDKNVDPGFD